MNNSLFSFPLSNVKETLYGFPKRPGKAEMRGYEKTIGLPQPPFGTTLELWLDPDDIDSLVFYDPTLISIINDKSEYKREFNFVSARPGYNSAMLNGRGGLNLKGTSYLEGGAFGDFNFMHDKTPYSVYFITRLNEENTGATIKLLSTYFGTAGTNGMYFQRQNGLPDDLVTVMNATSSGSTYNITQISPFASKTIYKIRHVVLGNLVQDNDYELYLNDALVDSTASLSGTVGTDNHPNKLRIADINSVNQDFLELLIYKHSTANTPEEINNFNRVINRYLFKKFNL